MVMSAIFKLMLAALAMTLCQGQGQDNTLIAGSFGAEIVNIVVGRIRSKCIFSEDRLFLRRTAYVMSRDGESTDTYKANYNGGIWKVSQSLFQTTLNCKNPLLKAACDSINANFLINWPSVTWSDLRKPLYSGLAAALATRLALGSSQMAGGIANQAKLWAKMYSLPEAQFSSVAGKTPSFECKDKLDLAFILDSSGSVSGADFSLMLQFAGDVVDVMNVSANGVRVADIVYSSRASVHFDLNDAFTKAAVKQRFLNTPKAGGGTNTKAGLDSARSILYSESRGARSDVKKVAVLVTDGMSSSFSGTTAAAARLKAAGTTVFAVGVGNYRLDELQAVASEPKCSHVLTLTSFDHITSILTEIQKSTCEANNQFSESKGIRRNETEGEIKETFSAPAPDNSTKEITAEVSCGILNIYVSSKDPRPGPAVFDNYFRAAPGYPAVLTSVAILPQGTPVYITVIGIRLPNTYAALRTCTDFTWSLGVVQKRDVTVTCIENNKKVPCTNRDIVETGQCPKNDWLTFPVKNPCTPANLGQGILRHSYPYDPNKFLQCDMTGQYYLTLCPGDSIYNTVTRECGFTSVGASPPPDTDTSPGRVTLLPSSHPSPCTQDNLRAKKFYHPYGPQITKFIQCDEWGKAYLMTCRARTQWSQSHYTCIHATKTVQCVHGHFDNDPCDHQKYRRCVHGKFVSVPCQSGLFYDNSLKTCTWTDNNPNPIPASCATTG